MEIAFKHSPAPWLINQNQHRLFIETPGGYPSLFDTYKLSEGVVIANLRLAAASPEMYECLQTLKKCCKAALDGTWEINEDGFSAMIEQIDEVLEKAEGKVK